ncbi:restriction endonuclease subunit S [Micromonospora sp. PLK6-60]|uniref:restriction endonuclease subunit S n=1 Tax=Micromonospora sp. PLK6-60 TaxID=2873383 RepID=UPI001CA72789|nr:restriction endonuclease subunit S [Micromonospora sp. PLK6-60]MBY8872705.1 restriction endonuclease subunit S [Micromonospora sp. PLK6-60]
MTDLPPGWTNARLGDVVAINPRTFDHQPDDDDMVSMVPMASVEAESGRMDASQSIRYGDAKKRSLTPFQEGDVMFAKVTPCMENGKIALASGLVGGRALGSTELFALRSLGAVEPGYLAHFLLQPAVRRAAQAAMTGAVGLRRVPRSYLTELLLPLPPLPEQRRILSAIDAKLSRLKAGLGILVKQLLRLRALKKRLLIEAVPLRGGECWRTVTVAEAGRVDLGRQRHPDWHTGLHMRPYLRVANVFEDRIDTSDIMEMDFPPAVFERFKLSPGDILLNEGQSPELLGRPALYRGVPEDIAFTNSILRFRAGPGVDPEWALLVFRRHMHAGRFSRELRITTNIAHLSASRFKAVEFPVPPLAEQRDIVARTNERLSGIERLIEAIERTRKQAAGLRASLLAEAFAGRFVPQDPNDEPATELLARIKAERAMTIPKQRTRSRRTPKELPAPPTRVTGDDYQQETLPL